MSRLPGPEEQWIESSEGDLDPDLAEEYPYSDWEPAPQPWWWSATMRVVLLLLIAALVVPAIVLTAR